MYTYVHTYVYTHRTNSSIQQVTPTNITNDPGQELLLQSEASRLTTDGCSIPRHLQMFTKDLKKFIGARASDSLRRHEWTPLFCTLAGESPGTVLCLSVCVFVCLFVLSLCLGASLLHMGGWVSWHCALSICLCICLSVCLILVPWRLSSAPWRVSLLTVCSACACDLSVFLSVFCLSFLPTCLSVCMSVCLSVCLSVLCLSI